MFLGWIEEVPHHFCERCCGKQEEMAMNGVVCVYSLLPAYLDKDRGQKIDQVSVITNEPVSNKVTQFKRVCRKSCL